LYGLFWADKFNLGWAIIERDQDEGHEQKTADTMEDEPWQCNDCERV
jgi:hypothetical protein